MNLQPSTSSVLSAGLLWWITTANTLALDTNQIQEWTGLKGTWNATEGVFKVSAPRNDVSVKVDAWKMPPFMGLTSWASFLAGKKQEAMVMGDLVLFEDEVNPLQRGDCQRVPLPRQRA